MSTTEARNAQRTIGEQLFRIALVAICATVLVLLSGFVILRLAWRDLERDTLTNRASQTREIFARVSANERKVVEEYAYWDDTYRFIDNPATPTSAVFIRENFIEWLPRQHDEEFIVLYNRQHKPVFQWVAEGKLLPAGISEPAFFVHLDSSKSVAGLLRSNSGLIMLAAAPVMRTSVAARGTGSNGYLVFGRQVSRAFLENIEREADASVKLSSLHGSSSQNPGMDQVIRTYINPLDDSSHATFTLLDVYGRPAAEANMAVSRSTVLAMRNKVFMVFGMVFLVALALIALVWIRINRMVISPLSSIGTELRAMQDAGKLNTIQTRGPSSEWRLLVSSFNGAVRDNDQRENLEVQLRQAQKMEAVGRLAGGIAHDLNNITGALLVGASLVKMETEHLPEARSAVETIEQSARRAATLTRRLLTFARPAPAVTGPVSVNETVRNVERLCVRMLGPKIQIRTQLGEELPLIHGDASQIEQAVLNLCINARDAMPSGGDIIIETGMIPASRAAVLGTMPVDLSQPASGKYVVISVKDTGTGMDDETRSRVFEPFFSTKENGKGTGLGLSSVYGIARAHEGTAVVTSAPGIGSKFSLLLPVPLVPLAPFEGNDNAVSPARGTGTILVVDDEDTLRSVTRKVLEKLGYSVIEAANGVEAVQIVRQQGDSVDVILLDLVMPEMDGMNAFRQIRSLHHDIPVLIASAYANEDDLQVLMEHGADGFLQKPFDIQVMANAVREAIEKRKTPAG